MNWHLGDRALVTDPLSYYWSCVGTVVKVETLQVTLRMFIDGKKIVRSTCMEFISSGAAAQE